MFRIAVAILLSLLPLTSLHAQSNPTYIPIGQAKGVLYRPDAAASPHIGIVLIHRVANYLSHVACTEFSKRGFLVLCMNSRFDNNEVRVAFEQIALDVKAGIERLKNQPGIDKIVLFAHSGGGPTLSFYEAVAENGLSYCQDPHRLSRCDDDLANLPRADAIVYADAHPGYPMTILRGFNPAVIDESDLSKVDKTLDPFDSANGYNPQGTSHYTPEFQRRYFEAQSERMNRLIDRALDIKARMVEGNYPYRDNDLIVIPRGGNPLGGPGGVASLHVLDPSIEDIMSTSRPQKMIKNDGTEVTEIIKSVARPDPRSRETNMSFDNGTKLYSVTSFLSSMAVRSTNSLNGIDHCSSNNSTVCAAQSISIPSVFYAMGASSFVRDNELMFDKAKSSDKEYYAIEGALHRFEPCKACETIPGQYSNTTKNLFDHAAAWINKRMN
jgi:hypothetical protein